LSEGADAESRKVSGRSDIRNEDFSPILLERRQASNGKTTFGPAELPPDELRKRLEKLRQNQMLLTGDPNEDSAQSPMALRNIESTQDYARLDGFVNFQRGGRSGEGSFRNRMLSSALNDSSELNPEESLQASTPKQFPTVRVERWASSELVPADSPDLPRVPDPSPEKHLAPVHLSTGSPLKLFQPYDTFTNQTLLRRLSQMHGDAADSSFSIAVDPDSRLQEDSPSRLLPPARNDTSAYANRFGAGELDGYVFNDEFSHITHDVTGVDGDKENRDPEGDSMLPSHPPIFDLTHNSSPSEAPDIVVSRRRKSTTSHPSRRSARASFPGYVDLLHPHGERRDSSGPEIKRPRTSPSKAPTPKRRRTLHRSDVSYGTEELGSAVDSVQLSHHQMQSALGRFREDADSHHETADLDARPSLRPRTPTPSQRSSLQRDRQPLTEIERSPARSSRHSHAPMALPVGAAVDTERKTSIKTEDFINEANKIMAMIRSKAGLRSGLASVEESDEGEVQPSPELDGSFEESTQEPFSRPPSREGRPPLKRLSTKQEDPVLAEQLKKYEEPSDMGDMITSSVRSDRIPQQTVSATQEEDGEERNDRQSRASDSAVGTVSDPPNIRISRNPDWQQQQPYNGLTDGVPSQGSTGFNSQSTGISIPTGSSRGSSRGSEARKTIMPESVSHLIPDQVGNMVLDRQRNIWVKRKGSGESKESFMQSEISEDDPFAGIPDLSVDVTKEMQNLLLTGKKEAVLQDRLPGATQISPSRPPRMVSATKPVLDTTGKPAVSHQHRSSARAEHAVEHEISIHEGRVKEPRRLTISFSSPVASVIQDAAGIQDLLSEDSIPDQAAERRDAPARGRRIVSVRGTTRARSRSNSRGPPRHLSVRGKSVMARPVSRIEERDEHSGLDQAQYQEPVSGMELSVLGDYSIANREDSGRQASLSFVVATPRRAPSCPAAGIDAAPVISQYVGTFSLSPLSEFTIHRAEETLPLEASYVVDDHRLVTGDRSKRVMSLSMRELVDKLAEVEPFEPYWEDMRELELREKNLSALHALDEFCGQLESLDVSKNKIRNLGGVPSSVRHLRMTDNQLSSLTSWNHLMNLQYVDVSNNGLTSLAAFQNLIHLRTLRADNNQITSLDGIKFHKGLQTLRARGNLIEEVDFDGNTLHQLTDLDLKNNQITRIANVGQLPSLSALNLEGNRLSIFSIESENPMTTLRYLRLDDNKLTTLNVSKLSHLRLLHADRNALVHIAGFSRARRIDSLSLREQHGAKPLDLSHLLNRAYEVRKLYLSGNLLESFAPTIDLLNLQLLELANCGLSALPEEVGLMMPNLRVLNLNMNALSDLSPLRAVPRLKRLFVAGNRLADPVALVNALSGWQHLAVVDVRDNPMTQGFYAPVQVQAVVRRQQHLKRGGDDEMGREGCGEGEEMFVLGDQDAERDGLYCGRLDMDTRVRRRLYETMVGKRCARVRKLDGLLLKRGDELGRKGAADGEWDVVWLAMKERGLVRDEGGKEEEVVGERSGRWPAEDSFA
jgi:Leucine-rich repeat (LRR) protein